MNDTKEVCYFHKVMIEIRSSLTRSSITCKNCAVKKFFSNPLHCFSETSASGIKALIIYSRIFESTDIPIFTLLYIQMTASNVAEYGLNSLSHECFNLN